MARKLLKRVGAGFAVLATGIAVLAAYIQVDGIPRYDPPTIEARNVTSTPERVERGAKLAGLLCTGCHESQDTHRLTGQRLDDLPKEFGPIYAKNITRHPTKGIGAWTDGELRTFLRTGLRKDGSYAPPYMPKYPHTSDEDLDSVIAFLRSDDPRVAPSDVEPGTSEPSFLVKALTHGPFKPLPSPKAPIAAPDPSDRVAYGRYLTVSLDCYSCHSADFTKVDVLEPEKSAGYLGGGNRLKDADGDEILSANLTPDPKTGIGSWTEAQFTRAVREGFRPDGRVLHSPMLPKTELTVDETAAIYAYLRTVPPIENAVRRPAHTVAAAAGGKAVYEKYGCGGCHGQTGQGALGDLRRANATYPSDAELRRWLDEAPAIKPGTKMPAWKGIIEEEDYAPLMGYVRHLSTQAEKTSMR